MGRPSIALVGFVMGACGSAPASQPAITTPTAHATLAAAVPHAVRAPSRVHVLVGGDVIPHRPQLDSPQQVGAALAPLGELFQAADAAIVNYETATGDVVLPPSARMSLAASPAWMRAVTSAHVTALTLANNHACDLGTKGLSASIDAAGSLGVAALGADEVDPWHAVVVAESNGKKVCAVAWTTFVNTRRSSCESSGQLAIARPNHAGRLRVARAIAAAYQRGCDSVIAIAHGGEEYAAQTDGMLEMARAAADAGADAVIFHHPHVVSPVTIYGAEDGRRVPIFESLGNLVSNQGESWTPAYPATQEDRHVVYLNGWTRIGMVADLDLRLDATPHVAAYGYHLVFVESDHVLDKSNPHPRITTRPLDPERDRTVIAKLSRDPDGPTRVFDDACWMERASSPTPTCR